MKKGVLIILAFILTISLVGCTKMTDVNQDVNPKQGAHEFDTGNIEPAFVSGVPTSNDKDNNTDKVLPTDRVATSNPNTPVSINKGITVNRITFKELVDADLSEQIYQSIEQSKQNKGYEFFLDKDGYYTLVVYAGEKNSGGYGIMVKSIEDNEGMTNIVVEETEPPSGASVTMAITYPYTVVKYTGTTDNFNIVDTKGETYQPIK